MFRTWTRRAALFLVAIIAVSALAIIAVSTRAGAQRDVWSLNSESRAQITRDKAVTRQSFPNEFKLFNLDIEPLREQLFSIVGSNARQRSTTISLPNAAGGIEQFEVFED